MIHVFPKKDSEEGYLCEFEANGNILGRLMVLREELIDLRARGMEVNYPKGKVRL